MNKNEYENEHEHEQEQELISLWHKDKRVRAVVFTVSAALLLICFFWFLSGCGSKKQKTTSTTTSTSTPATLVTPTTNSDTTCCLSQAVIDAREIAHRKAVLEETKIQNEINKESSGKPKIVYRTKVVKVPVSSGCSTASTSTSTSTYSMATGNTSYSQNGNATWWGKWIPLWNPTHTLCKKFPWSKTGYDQAIQWITDHNENVPSNFPNKEVLPD